MTKGSNTEVIKRFSDRVAFDFILVAGAALSIVSFLLSFVGAVDEIFPYLYFINFYLVTIFLVGGRFDRAKTVVVITVISCLHLIYVFFFYPSQPSLEFTSGIIYNIIIILFFYLTGFVASIQQKKWTILIEEKEAEYRQLKREIAKKDKVRKDVKTTDPGLSSEKKLHLYASFLQVEEEIIKALLAKKRDFLQHVTMLMQTKLRFSRTELFYQGDSGFWKTTGSFGEDQAGYAPSDLKDKLCRAVASEKCCVSSGSELIHKYRINVDDLPIIIGMPIIVNGTVRGVIIMEGFKDDFLSDVDRFCQKLAMCLAKGGE